MIRKRPLRAVLIAALGLMALAPGAASAAKPTITLSGSTSVAPLAAQLARGYLRACDGCVKFKLLQGGSDVGVNDVARGRVTIGMSSRDPKPSDPGGIVFNMVAKDAICLISHGTNTLPGLSRPQVQAIFSGDVRNWSGVPGSSRDDTINLYVRTPASGTQDAFDKIFMSPKKIFSGATRKASNGLIQSSVRGDGSGVGYVSLAFTEGVHNIPYQGIPCTLRNAKSGQYGGLRSFYFVTRGAPAGAAKRWINWIKNNAKAKRITAREWVPLS